MVPSRGLANPRPILCVWKDLIVLNSHAKRRFLATHPCVDIGLDPGKPVHSFVSRSNDPYLNLSFEHFLLKESPPNSTVLFLYINRPSIIIGRNQNPWLEVNLGLINAAEQQPVLPTEPQGIGNVDLIRRISGGGTVFHDEGNVNWTVICPPSAFTRDKHVELIVRALRKLGVERARVNERHDIVLDQGSTRYDIDVNDTHTSPFPSHTIPLKVSGSAYKLTRTRALHHGTCLLNSPNLNIIPEYLHSPAKSYIEAKGVASVSSPISNINLLPTDFVNVVQDVFQQAYDLIGPTTLQTVGAEALHIQAIKDMSQQLKSPEWTFCQTPQFTINVGKREHQRGNSTGTVLNLKVRHGVLEEGKLEDEQGRVVSVNFEGRKLHEITNWEKTLRSVLGHNHVTSDEPELVTILTELFPSPRGYGSSP